MLVTTVAEQQRVARAARAVGGYRELVERSYARQRLDKDEADTGQAA